MTTIPNDPDKAPMKGDPGFQEYMAECRNVLSTTIVDGVPDPDFEPTPQSSDLSSFHDTVRRVADEMHTCAHTFTEPTRKAVDVWAHDLYAAISREPVK